MIITFGRFTRRDSRINRTKKLVSDMIRNEREFVQKNNIKRHTPDGTRASRCSHDFTSILQFQTTSVPLEDTLLEPFGEVFIRQL